MTNFRCSAVDDTHMYNFTTEMAVIMSQAIEEFMLYVIAEGGEWESLAGILIEAVENEGELH